MVPSLAFCPKMYSSLSQWTLKKKVWTLFSLLNMESPKVQKVSHWLSKIGDKSATLLKHPQKKVRTKSPSWKSRIALKWSLGGSNNSWAKCVFPYLGSKLWYTRGWWVGIQWLATVGISIYNKFEVDAFLVNVGNIYLIYHDHGSLQVLGDFLCWWLNLAKWLWNPQPAKWLWNPQPKKTSLEVWMVGTCHYNIALISWLYIKQCNGCEILLLMEGILHQLIWIIFHCAQSFIDNRWCRISSINKGAIPLKTNECPLKNGGWKTMFCLKWSLFRWHVNFQGGISENAFFFSETNIKTNPVESFHTQANFHMLKTWVPRPRWTRKLLRFAVCACDFFLFRTPLYIYIY